MKVVKRIDRDNFSVYVFEDGSLDIDIELEGNCASTSMCLELTPLEVKTLISALSSEGI